MFGSFIRVSLFVIVIFFATRAFAFETGPVDNCPSDANVMDSQIETLKTERQEHVDRIAEIDSELADLGAKSAPLPPTHQFVGVIADNNALMVRLLRERTDNFDACVVGVRGPIYGVVDFQGHLARPAKLTQVNGTDLGWREKQCFDVLLAQVAYSAPDGIVRFVFAGTPS